MIYHDASFSITQNWKYFNLIFIRFYSDSHLLSSILTVSLAEWFSLISYSCFTLLFVWYLESYKDVITKRSTHTREIPNFDIELSMDYFILQSNRYTKRSERNWKPEFLKDDQSWSWFLKTPITQYAGIGSYMNDSLKGSCNVSWRKNLI